MTQEPKQNPINRMATTKLVLNVELSIPKTFCLGSGYQKEIKNISRYFDQPKRIRMVNAEYMDSWPKIDYRDSAHDRPHLLQCLFIAHGLTL